MRRLLKSEERLGMHKSFNKSGFWSESHRGVVFLLACDDEAAFKKAIEDRTFASFAKSKASFLKDVPGYLDWLPRQSVETAIQDIFALTDASPVLLDVYTCYDQTRVAASFLGPRTDKTWRELN